MPKIIVFGDSIAYGKWDTRGGWVARLRVHVESKRVFDGSYQDYQIYNQSVSGEVAVRAIERIKPELGMRITLEEESNEHVVLFALGLNDANPFNSITEQASSEYAFKTAIAKMVEYGLRKKARIGFIGLTPMNETRYTQLFPERAGYDNKAIYRYDRYISEICNAAAVPKLELFSELKSNRDYMAGMVDGIHPNDLGHQLLHRRVRVFLETRILR